MTSRVTEIDPLLSIPELAERTNLSERWWRRAVFERRIPYLKFGKLVRVRESDLKAFMDANFHEAAAR